MVLFLMDKILTTMTVLDSHEDDVGGISTGERKMTKVGDSLVLMVSSAIEID